MKAFGFATILGLCFGFSTTYSAEFKTTVMEGAPPQEAILNQAVLETRKVVDGEVVRTRSVNGIHNPMLCELTRAHAKYAAENNDCTHTGSNDRYARMEVISRRQQKNSKRYSHKFGEIVSEATGSTEQAARMCARQWRDSTTGHWDSMRKEWDSYCYSMHYARGKWCCVGIFADGIRAPRPKIDPRKPRNVLRPIDRTPKPDTKVPGRSSSRSGLK